MDVLSEQKGTEEEDKDSRCVWDLDAANAGELHQHKEAYTSTLLMDGNLNFHP